MISDLKLQSHWIDPAVELAEIERRYHSADIGNALNAAHLAIDEYYSGNREWAEKWLISAWNAGRDLK